MTKDKDKTQKETKKEDEPTPQKRIKRGRVVPKKHNPDWPF